MPRRGRPLKFPEDCVVSRGEHKVEPISENYEGCVLCGGFREKGYDWHGERIDSRRKIRTRR